MLKLRLLSLTLLLALTACGSNTGPTGTQTVVSEVPSPETPTVSTATATAVPAAALVNGEIISKTEFEAEVDRVKAAQTELGNDISDEQAASRAMDDLVNQVLLAQGAQTAGYNVDDATLDDHIASLTTSMGGADALSAWMQAQGYTEASFQSALRRGLAAAWMRDQIITGVPMTAEQVHVRQILLYNEERANNMLAQIQAGSDFDELAALADPVTHGELGWFPRGYLGIGRHRPGWPPSDRHPSDARGEDWRPTRQALEKLGLSL